MRHFSALVSQPRDVTSSGGAWMQLGGARSLPHGEEDLRGFAPKAGHKRACLLGYGA